MQQLRFYAQQKFQDADHHCFAYIAGKPTETVQLGFGDDGEPPGTAGLPILRILQGSQIGQVGAVVIRYFGGIKLGTGNLSRAYMQATRQALIDLPSQPFNASKSYYLQGDFADEQRIRHWCQQQQLTIENVKYDANGIILQITWPDSLPTDLTALNQQLIFNARWL